MNGNFMTRKNMKKEKEKNGRKMEGELVGITKLQFYS